MNIELYAEYLRCGYTRSESLEFVEVVVVEMGMWRVMMEDWRKAGRGLTTEMALDPHDTGISATTHVATSIRRLKLKLAGIYKEYQTSSRQNLSIATISAQLSCSNVLTQRI